jgi:hypothetical protein
MAELLIQLLFELLPDLIVNLLGAVFSKGRRHEFLARAVFYAFPILIGVLGVVADAHGLLGRHH